MCSIKFLVRQPWLYALAGLALLALMCISIFDVHNGGGVQPMENFQIYSGKLSNIETQAAFKAPQEKGGEPVQNYVYKLTIALDDGREKMLSATVVTPLAVGMKVTAHVGEKGEGKVYNLVADEKLIINHQNAAAQALAKAESAKATMTHPITLIFIGMLIFVGIGGEIFKRRRPDLHAKYSMCAIDRIKVMEEVTF